VCVCVGDSQQLDKESELSEYVCVREIEREREREYVCACRMHSNSKTNLVSVCVWVGF